uniref:Uncharacterized protein LOC100368288 n=1 Tax=Saccoglossus kowalevskii TaxID=10224 RepID=A0ABM0MGA2_SACKO|nr:PREDICTED: uncharacterized protein LOC100368288 [Saccoglossus kowalevskii]
MCNPVRHECMSQLFTTNEGKLVFVSECQEIEACVQESQNEPKANNCDYPPLAVVTKCRYCCHDGNLTNELYCMPPEVPTEEPQWNICSCWGDPHCRSFDGRRFTVVGGECYYQLTSITHNGRRIQVEVDYTESDGRLRINSLRIIVTDTKGRGAENNSQKNNADNGKGIGPPVGKGNKKSKRDTETVTELEVGVNDGETPVEIRVNDVIGVFTLHQFEDKTWKFSLSTEEDGNIDVAVLWLPHHAIHIEIKKPLNELNIEGICGDSDGDPIDDYTGDVQVFAEGFADCAEL